MNVFKDRTIFPSFNKNETFNYKNLFYTAGSCFAEEFNKKLRNYQFPQIQHPFGICFNPISLSRQFMVLLSDDHYQTEEFILNDGLYHSLDHHGKYSNANKDQLLNSINAELEFGKKLIKKIDCLILTLGSAHYYLHLPSNRVAANCHKIPPTEFLKKRASLEESITYLQQALENLFKLNPNVRIILSVSPVRYLRDGFVENNRSKATLILCCDSLCKWNSQIEYFPAYEIFMDDLRDYRYAADDLVHPSNKAIDYIWSYFIQSYFNETTQKLIHQMNNYFKLLAHNISHPDAHSMKSLNHKIQCEKESIHKLHPAFK
ncbi:MAG: GSCFA domain-containing protein [Saprospiraceae bacterium]|nr:GSCFA domain-containing protein [Saprospiraceae bacterium]